MGICDKPEVFPEPPFVCHALVIVTIRQRAYSGQKDNVKLITCKTIGKYISGNVWYLPVVSMIFYCLFLTLALANCPYL